MILGIEKHFHEEGDYYSYFCLCCNYSVHESINDATDTLYGEPIQNNEDRHSVDIFETESKEERTGKVFGLQYWICPNCNSPNIVDYDILSFEDELVENKQNRV